MSEMIYVSFPDASYKDRFLQTSHDLPGLQKHFSWVLFNILNKMVEPDFPEKITFLSYAGCPSPLVPLISHCVSF
jgi:hypothetical protein